MLVTFVIHLLFQSKYSTTVASSHHGRLCCSHKDGWEVEYLFLVNNANNLHPEHTTASKSTSGVPRLLAALQIYRIFFYSLLHVLSFIEIQISPFRTCKSVCVPNRSFCLLRWQGQLNRNVQELQVRAYYSFLFNVSMWIITADVYFINAHTNAFMNINQLLNKHTELNIQTNMHGIKVQTWTQVLSRHKKQPQQNCQ